MDEAIISSGLQFTHDTLVSHQVKTSVRILFILKTSMSFFILRSKNSSILTSTVIRDKSYQYRRKYNDNWEDFLSKRILTILKNLLNKEWFKKYLYYS